MNWFESMTNSIEYIEQHLTQELLIEEVAKVANTSTFYYQRMFMLMTDMSVQTYIRNRRLTLAAMELMEKNVKIIDVAFKYGYDSSEAFSRAFKKMHGVSPSAVKNNKTPIKAFLKLMIQITLKGDLPMKYRLENKPAFSFYGMSKMFSTIDGANFKEIPLFWQQTMEDGSFNGMIKHAQDSKCLGVCMPMDVNQDTSFDYIIGAFSKEPVEGYSNYEVQAHEWAVFELEGPMHEVLQATWKRIFSEWFPQTGFNHADLPELEVYFDGDLTAKDYYMEIWIPIVR